MASWFVSASVSACAVALTACGGAGAAPPAPETVGAAEPVVRRGDFARRLLLTGEVTAEAGQVLTVPRTPSWRVEIRWLARDGTAVEAGQTVAELDNATFVAALEDRRLELAETASRLAQRQAERQTAQAEAAFAVERREIELEKARLKAAVPEDLLSRREAEDRRLARRKAELDLAQARDDLEAERVAGEVELAQLRIDLEGRQREIDQALGAIAALSLKAPVAGTVVVGRHPWEDRRLREGDSVWVGLPVARLPDLAKSTVTAQLADTDLGRLELRARALCALDAFPERSFPCRVEWISPIAREESGESLRRFFEVSLVPEPPGIDPLRMRPGMSVRVEVLDEPRRGVLLAPRAALDLGSQPPRARLAGGGLAELELGPCDAQDCVVEAGLAEGARLALGDGG